MKRLNVILVLLLAISAVAGSVPPPAACAASVSGTASGLQGSPGATAPVTVGGGSLGTTDVTGDPGGAGDGLGATPEMQGTDAAKNLGAGSVVEFMLQLLRLMQTVG